MRAGRTLEHGVEVVLMDVEHQADFAERVDGAIEQQLDVFEFAALPGILPGCRCWR